MLLRSTSRLSPLLGLRSISSLPHQHQLTKLSLSSSIRRCNISGLKFKRTRTATSYRHPRHHHPTLALANCIYAGRYPEHIISPQTSSIHTSPSSHWLNREVPESPVPLDIENAEMSVTERYGAPYQEQDQNEVNELIKALSDGSKRGKKEGFSCRKSEYDVDHSKLSVVSWKFQDWDYKKRDLPTKARGLFTLKAAGGNSMIVARGYDKFFNIDEVEQTKWSWIGQNTKAPYEVTMKENGCIIFISGLPDGNLLVCSKHSTGARADASKSHSVVGEGWVEQQLKKVGKTREQLAKFLYNANATAVAELCDDSFEEHILAYEGDDAGLYLHGVNLNLPVFATWSGPQVHAFADDWGFKKIEVFEKETASELKEFLEGVGESGEWNGRAVEGFVIRCKARHGPNDPEWHDWFFKYKFEEPYLMYRQWREVTKAIISGRQPKVKKHKQITEKYMTYAREQLRKNPAIGKAFQNNHGIIAMRDGFLASIGTSGHEIVKAEEAAGEDGKAKSLVLVPIATIGCGKTTVALGLVKLFGVGHIQNDNITVKKGKPQAFANAIVTALNEHPICVADRNNHQKRERDQLFRDINQLNPDVDYVALHYVHYKRGEDVISKIREKNQQRIFDRGDNHQTIHSGTGSNQEIIGIMEGFIQRFQSLDIESDPDSQFDLVIDLDPLAESRENLETVVSKLYEHYPYLLGEEMPSAEDLDEASRWALSDYTVGLKHVIGKSGSSSNAKPSREQQPQKGKEKAAPQPKSGGKQKQPAVEYYEIRLRSPPINAALDQALLTKPSDIKQFYMQLKGSRRVQAKFHITMVHRANAKKQADLWDHYEKLRQETPDGKDMDELEVKLERVVWDNRIMAIQASLVDSKGHECGNEFMHITIGTADSTVKPKESNDLLKTWSENRDNLEAVGIKEVLLGKDGEGIVTPGLLNPAMAR
ncbi:hypothetical protein TWF718_000788 [Orbilia javanica]|uniref:RNA ligase (ATP) n=1 Tax=Orbilia javanica TaxID=47235 RepID=A0AAN8RG73_9PEZI